MGFIFKEAGKEDIKELIELRIAYMEADFGQVSGQQRACMEKQLPDYFSRKLGEELIAFVAMDGEKIASAAYLHKIEMPASPLVLSGFYGEVLNVYTRPEYRGNGLCTKLIQKILEYAREKGLARVDLSATREGYPIYKKIGFKERETRYTEMRYEIGK